MTADLRRSDFPADFVWGVASSAFQIEGADGQAFSARAPSDDLDLIAAPGVNAYRFPVSWSRVQPLGEGAWSRQGLDFYDRLVDDLLRRGLQPHVALDHRDQTAALQERGGWGRRDTVPRFVEYALCVQRLLGNRISSLTTHNEPSVMAAPGHRTGVCASDPKDTRLSNQVAHHLLLSHGLALHALRASGCRTPLGIVLNLAPTQAAGDSEVDRGQARLEDDWRLRGSLDPLCHGRYPVDFWNALGADAPEVRAGDLEAIAAPLDFLGIGCSRSDAGPQGLTELLLRLQRDYDIPRLFVTDNGTAFGGGREHGRVHDPERVRHLQQHVAAVRDATQRRALKDGALWYRGSLQGGAR